MRRALVTGASGQDGYYLMRQLRGQGWTVHGLSRDGTRSTLPNAEPPMQMHAGDVRDHATVARLLNEVEPEVVYNLAGISSVAQSWERPVATAEVNAVAVVNLLDQSLKLQERLGRQVRFVQASSAEIFGQAKESPQTELTPLAPISPYGVAKAAGHQMVAVYRARGLFASSAILYNHESPRRPPQFVSRKVTMAAARISLGLQDSLVLGALDTERDWGWAPDYTDALIRIAGAEQAEDYIIATGQGHSLQEFVQQAFRAVGLHDWQKYVQKDDRFIRPTDPVRLVGDFSKAHKKLGWQPSNTFEELVAQMVSYDAELLGKENAGSRKEWGEPWRE